jgi:TfoX/Sxy family transcriptional regulator of competence genes
MKMSKADEATKAFFQAHVPDDPRVQVKPMFGQISGFANGNMFCGIFGDRILVRLSETDRAELLQEDDTAIFDPGNGRPMKEYVIFPSAWMDEPEKIDTWFARSLAWVGEMPEKQPKRRKK